MFSLLIACSTTDGDVAADLAALREEVEELRGEVAALEGSTATVSGWVIEQRSIPCGHGFEYDWECVIDEGIPFREPGDVVLLDCQYLPSDSNQAYEDCGFQGVYDRYPDPDGGTGTYVLAIPSGPTEAVVTVAYPAG